MKKNSPQFYGCRRVVLLVGLMTWVGAFGQTYPKWTGTGNWSTTSNWSTGTYPYDQLEFIGGGSAITNNDLSPETNQWRLFFSGGQAYTITGNPIHLYDFATAFSWVLSQSTVAQTINPLVSFRDAGTRIGVVSTQNTGSLNLGAVEVAGGVSVLRLSGYNTAGVITVGGILSGTGKPIMIGRDEINNIPANSRIVFTGANSFDGSLSIDAGILNLRNSSGAGTTTGGVNVASGAALELQGGIAVGNEALTLNGTGVGAGGALRNISGNNSWAGAVTLGSASRINSDAGTLTMNGSFSGPGLSLTFGGAGNTTITGIIGTTTGNVTKDGDGTLILSGNNTFNGITFVNAGMLRLGATGSGSATPLGNASNRTTVAAGAVLDLNGFTLSNNEDLTLNGTGISNGGALTNNPAATANVNWGGILTLGSNASVVASNGSINFTNTGSIGSSGAYTLTLGGASGGSIAQVLHNSVGAVTKEGAGTWILSGASTYTGATTINAGTLQISGGANRLPTGTAVTIANVAGATLDLNHLNQQIGSLAGGGTTGGAVALGGGNLTIGGTATTSFDGNMSGTGGFTKQGTGSQTLGGTNTYTGTTTILGGTLTYNASTAMSSTSAITLGGGILAIGTTPTSSLNAGNFTMTASSTIDVGTGSNTFTLGFAGFGGTFTGTLTINNWSPSANKHIVIPGLSNTELDAINFNGYGLGAKYDASNPNRVIPKFVYYTLAAGSGNFSTSASWLNGDNPTGTSCASNPATIVIQSGFTLTQDADYGLARIENQGIYNSGNFTITLCTGGQFVNNGMVSFSNGTLVCAGTATFSGSASSANFLLNHLTLNGPATLTTAPSIQGTLQLNTGGTIATPTAPVYTNTSTLLYNQGGTIALGNEWNGNAITTGSGIPQNVTIQNNTTLSFPTSNRGCAGNFLISSGNAVLNATSGDLYTAGNFTNNSTFTHNNRALFLNGTGTQTLNGTLNGTGTTNCFPYLLINKASGTVSLGTLVNVTNTLTLTNGTITLGANHLNITSGSAIAGAPFSNAKMIITNGTGQLVFSVLNDGANSRLFPIGETANYTPITINITASTGTGRTLGMRVVDAAVLANPLGIPTAATDYITRHWLPDAQGFTSVAWNGVATYAATGDVVGTAANLRFSVWLPAPENTWLDYGASPAGQTLTGGTGPNTLASLQTGAYITGRAIAPKLYYRSNATPMNWGTSASWETSLAADFSSGVSAGVVPPSALNSSGITIRSPHVVTINADATLDQSVIQSGAVLVKGAANLTINDGVGTDLEILNGGIFRHSGDPTATINGTGMVRTGGMVEITTNSTMASNYASSTNMSYETDAIFYWNINSPFSAATTFFPNANASTIPIFRCEAIGAGVGGGATIINGVFDAVGTVNWINSGTKTFRNGITGSGDVIQRNLPFSIATSDCGQFIINGTTSILSGTGTITLNASGLSISAGTCTLNSNKTVNATAGLGTFSVSNGATFNALTNSLTGNGNFLLHAGGTLQTAHANGVNGSIAVSGTKTFTDLAHYTFDGVVNQTTGSLMGAVVSNLTIGNTGGAGNNTVLLTNNNTSANTLNLNAGLFACGTSQTLLIPDGGTINGNGANQPNDAISGAIHFLAGGIINANLSTQPQLYNVILGNGGGANAGVNFKGSGSSNATILNSLTLNAQGYVSGDAPYFNTGSTLIYNSGGTYDKRVEMGQTTPGQPGYPWHVIIQNGTTVNMLPANVNSTQIMGGNFTVGLDGAGNGTMLCNNISQIIRVMGDLTIGGTTALGSITLSTSLGGDMEIQGNFTRNTTGTFTDNKREVIFMGSGNSTIFADAQNFAFLAIDKTSGHLTIDCPVGITGAITGFPPEYRLRLSSGYINTTSTNLITIGTEGVVSGGGTSSYVNGPLAKLFAPTGNLAEFVFPVGKSTATPVYNPCGVGGTGSMVTGSMATYTAEYFDVAHPLTGVMGSRVLGIMGNGHWIISRSGGTGSDLARVKLFYTPPPSGTWVYYGGTTPTPAADPCANCNVAVANRDIATTTWDYVNTTFNTLSPEYRYHTNGGWIYSTATNQFNATISPFNIAYGSNTILPVKLLAFDGRLSGMDGLLQWKIANPTDLSRFELEHSTNGSQFTSLANVHNNGGTSYGFKHLQLPAGNHYYRLLVKEKNGGSYYSPIVLITVGGLQTQITGLANPLVRGGILVKIISPASQSVQATLTDVAGRTLGQHTGQLMPGANQWCIGLPSLPPGMYFITIITKDNLRQTFQFVKE